MKIENKKVIVLFSGGIDSTACISYYLQRNFKVEGLFVNYGQKAYKYEKVAVEKISEYFDINTQTIKINSKLIIENGVIQGRNNFLLSIALMNFQYSNGLISLGIHSGTDLPDCSKDFVQKEQEIFDVYSSGNITIDCPFVDMTKRDIFEFCIINKLPLNLTYSCENGSAKQPCGKCSTCKDLIDLYEIESKKP